MTTRRRAEAPDVTPIGAQARILVVTAFLAAVTTSVSWATFEYMVVAIQTEMGLSIDVLNAISRVGEGASLIVVFIAGSIGDRLGRGRVIVAGSAAFCVGAVMVMAATGPLALALGRAVGGVGGTLMTVTAVAVVKETFSDDGQRARVFGMYAAMTPAVLIVTPPLGAAMTQHWGWRTVPLLWLVLGAATLALTLWRVPLGGGTGARGDILTPLLAGVALASAALGIAGGAHGASSAVPPLVVCAIAIGTVIGLRRRPGRNGLDLSLLRDRRFWPVALAIFLAMGANLASFGSLYLQYRYPGSVVNVALLLVVPHAGAVVGSLLGGQLGARLGARQASVLLLAASSVACLGVLLVRPDSPPWVLVATLSVAAVPLAAAVGPLTQTFMDLAPPEAAGSTSSIRNAVTYLRGTVTGVITGAIVFATFESSLSQSIAGSGVPREVADDIAHQLRSGAAINDVVAGPVAWSEQVIAMLTGPAEALHAAQAQALVTTGVLTALAYLVATGAMVVSLRQSRLRAPNDEPIG